MARFDVYPHPDAAMRAVTPFLLDVQNNFIDQLQSRIVIPRCDLLLLSGQLCAI